MTTVLGRRLAVASVAAAAAGLLACVDSADRVTSIGDGGELGRIGDGNLVRVSNVQVVPGSAEAGDTVRLVGNVTVAPEVAFTVTGSVDGTARTSETRTGRFEGVLQLVLGDAADLIAGFGPGFHRARFELRVGEPNSITIVRDATFQLR